MFFKSALFSLASIVVLVAANPVPATSADQCSTGALQCCNSITSASDPNAASILNSIGVVVQGVDALVGLGCTAVSVIGVGQTTCNAQAACCTNNAFEGLINIGCTPISL